ncbi:MAG: response regulator [Chloroflexi bacterium]|nr:response regulator [Chloroflexota bacterium]
MSQHVLMIEDDVDLATIFSAALENSGFSVEIAKNGKIALQRLGETTPDLIVLDMHLPHFNGAQILSHIRSDGRLAHIPVIVTTADARMGESMVEMADVVLIKPVSYQQLTELAQRFQR